MKRFLISAVLAIAVGVCLVLGDFSAASAALPLAGDLVSHFQAHPELAGLLIGTTLAADKYRSYELGDQSHVPAVATDIIYEGAAVGDNASGYGRPLNAGDPFRGFALQQCDNSTGAAGDKSILVRTKGEIEVTVSSAAITDVGKAVYMSDDDTFTYTEGSNSYLGRVKRYVSSTKVVVEFDATRGGLGQLNLVTYNTGGTTLSDNTTAIGTFSGTAAVQEQLNSTLVDRINKIIRMLSK